MKRKQATKSNKSRNFIISIVAVAALVMAGWYVTQGYNPLAQPQEHVAVHFIDVGQGDAVLIAAHGQFMLIDGGERGNEDHVINYLRRQGVQRIDYLVATHPHSDHIGALANGVIDAFPIGTIIAPQLPQEITPTTRVYENFLAAVRRAIEAGTSAEYAEVGRVITLGNTEITILGPLRENIRNLNNNSVVLRLDYGNTSALFTGDAERAAERDLADEYGRRLQVCLLHVGHHGSHTSSHDFFLRYVAPVYAVLNVGLNNRHNHPRPEVMTRLRNTHATIFRTDIDGHVVMFSDGVQFWRAG
ncbi:MAG: MBL fold metallo-hydrolase [Oscillospiraceae bacterium]|nr:MBL fold metallo-hydrolase [Oscillospiraceae bacterium]